MFYAHDTCRVIIGVVIKISDERGRTRYIVHVNHVCAHRYKIRIEITEVGDQNYAKN